MDPLSDNLALINPLSYVTGNLIAGGEWSIRHPHHPFLKCYSLVQGECWLAVQGVASPVHLQAGTCFLLSRGWPFVLASNLAIKSIDGSAILRRDPFNETITLGEGGDVMIYGGHFSLEEDARFLLDVLPPIVTLKDEPQNRTVHWAIEKLHTEMRSPQPGGALLARHIAQTMLVEAMRSCIGDGSMSSTGWLAAFSDKRMHVALTCIHRDPARNWTVADLAKKAGMSRTTFSKLFNDLVGETPINYLLQWRMTLASQEARFGKKSVAELARSLGYRSESAFAVAFKKRWGTSPSEYRTRHVSLCELNPNTDLSTDALADDEQQKEP